MARIETRNSMPFPGLLNHAYRKHVMLLYDSDDERKDTAVDYINEGLKSGHLCIYASVDAYDNASKWHYSNLSSKIKNFDENLTQGNLVIIDFKPFFEAARKGDPTLFNQIKSQLETMLNQRVSDGRGDKILLFSDAACTLSENREFEESIELESWWHSAHQEWIRSSSQQKNITVLCPHPAVVFNEEKAAHAKAQIAAVHSVVLEAGRHYYQQPKTAAGARPIRRVLVAESDEDIQLVYRLGFDLLRLKLTIVSTGGKCLDTVFNTVNKKDFDMIILDTHLKDMSGIKVARKIKQRLPDQRIIITSTTAVSVEEIEHLGISRDYVLEKPFHFSKLRALINL